MKTLVQVFTAGMALVLLTQCKTNPNKAEKIDTEIKNHGQVSGDTAVGVKDGNLVVQKKVQMNEELRRMQIEVYELEDRVFGNRKYGSLGLYGVLKQCKADLSEPKNGGDGKLKWTEPMDRITDKEDEFKIGLDEKDKLVGVSEEFLKDRLERFRGYKKVLMTREDEYEEKVQICKTEMKSRQQAKAN
ncbi:MAG: hypothetical protein B7Y39_05485 [Bdellovibrio sp. 28-41-41]|nr:MAG: hypothetical protein B7Y39_05485 [Bdellovibrio sp. 28-41-41]